MLRFSLAEIRAALPYLWRALEERLSYTEKVRGSSPLSPTTNLNRDDNWTASPLDSHSAR